MPQIADSNGFPQNCVARALYDNIAESPDELAFRTGDILTVLEQNTSGLEGWWLCSLRGRQGICPGNRLRILAGIYDTAQKICNSGNSDFNSPQQESSRRNWQNQSNKVITPQKVGDVYLYDSPVNKISENRYDVPSSGSPIPILNVNNGRNSAGSKCSSRPESSRSSGGYGSDVFHTPRSSCDIVGSYDTPKWPLQRSGRNGSESYDIPRPLNSTGTVSPSSSVSSLAMSASDSMSSSNRSSIAPDYDIPRSRPIPYIQLHLQKLEENQLEVQQIPPVCIQPRELPLELNSAIENLETLESEITTAIGKLLSYAGPCWREREKLEPKLMDIKLAVLRLRSSLHDLSEFSEGVLGNAINAPDKGLSMKLRPLVKTLIETNSVVQESSKELDCYEWSVETLAKDLNSPNMGDSEYTLDALDQLIVCARSLTEDIRQFTSFVQGNATLLFKKCNAQDLNKQEKEDSDYVNFETHKTLKKQHSDVRDVLSDDMQKSYDLLIREAETGVFIDENKTPENLQYADRQVLLFYAAQCSTHTLHLTHAIDAFLNTVEHNQPPKVFLAHGKFIILNAYKLVHIGDTVSRNVSCTEISSKVLTISNLLSETLASTVHKIKTAALQFPSVTAVQEMVDSVVDVSHIARDLKLCIIISSQA